MDARVDEGRSGGPIVNVRDGKVIAIASHNVGGGARHEASPIAFAAPILTNFYRSIGEEGTPEVKASFRRSGKQACGRPARAERSRPPIAGCESR